MWNMQRIGLVLTLVNSGLLFGFLASSRLTAAPAVEPVVRTGMLELVDQNATVRALLKVEASGEVVFRLTDQAGNIRVKLGAGADGSGLVLLNDATEPGIHMLATATSTRVTLKGKAGGEKLISP